MDVKKNIAFRGAFVFFCLMPTALHLWSIFSSPSTKKVSGDPSAVGLNTSKEDPPSKKDSKLLPATNSDTNQRQKQTNIPWAKEQGIDVHSGRLGGVYKLTRSDLPTDHPLGQLPFHTIEIVETENRVELTITELVMSQTELNALIREFQSGKFAPALGGGRDVSLRVNRMSVKQLESVPSQNVELFGVNVNVSTAGKSVIISGRRGILNGPISRENAAANDQTGFTQFPFRINIVTASNQSTLEFAGQAFPLWLLDNQLATRWGSSAELNGRLNATFRSNQGPREYDSIRFQGWANAVDCSKLTSWLSSGAQPLATGACQIQCDDFTVQQNRVRSFRGIVRSSSNGFVVSNLVSLFGGKASWSSEKSNAEFQSFLFDVSFQQNELEIKSKYEGRLLIWNRDGESILVAR